MGSVKMKCYLSGMPELRLGLNDKVMFESTGRSAFFPFLSSLTRSYLLPSSHSSRVLLSLSPKTASRGKSIEMEDVKFHQCVRLARFENDRTISFIPPDGEFELMSYRLSTPVKPLIWVEGASSSCPLHPPPPSRFPLLSLVNRGRKDVDALLSPPPLSSPAAVENHRGSRVEYIVKVRAQFKRRSTANNVEILVPVPDDADSPKFRVCLSLSVFLSSSKPSVE